MYLMLMRRSNKILACCFVAFFLSSLTVRSETAPNLLELTEGLSTKGDYYEDDVLGVLNFSVEKIWHDTFCDEDIMEFSRDLNFTPPYDPIVNVSSSKVTSLVIKDNRSVIIPAARYYIESGDDTIIVFLNYTDSLELDEEDLIITFNGINYTFFDLDPGLEFYSNITYWAISFLLGNAAELYIMPLTKYAISPQATIGQEIEYGPYAGEVMAFTVYNISETEYFEVIEVHHNEVEIIYEMFETPQSQIIGETTILYEKNTGIVLHWLEYNSTADIYYFYNATEVVGISPLSYIPEYSVPFIALLSSILIAIPIFMVKRKKNL